MAALTSVGQPVVAFASSTTTKVYAANGRRMAVIKDGATGHRVYGENGRRIALTNSR